MHNLDNSSSLGPCSHIMSASRPGSKAHCGCQEVSLCHGWTGKRHCQYYIHALELFHTRVTNFFFFLEDGDLICRAQHYDAFFTQKRGQCSHCSEGPPHQPALMGEAATTVTDCFFNTRRAEIPKRILRRFTVDPQFPHFKKH